MCAQSCLTLWDPMDCSLPGSSVYGILQAGILEWVATSFSRRSSRPRGPSCILCLLHWQVDYHWATWETHKNNLPPPKLSSYSFVWYEYLQSILLKYLKKYNTILSTLLTMLCLWRRKWQYTTVFLPGKFHGQRNLAGYSPWGRKEADTTEQLHFTSLLSLRRKWHPLQYSCLGNPMDREAWWATVHGVTKQLDTTLHTHTAFLNTLLPHLLPLSVL